MNGTGCVCRRNRKRKKEARPTKLSYLLSPGVKKTPTHPANALSTQRNTYRYLPFLSFSPLHLLLLLKNRNENKTEKRKKEKLTAIQYLRHRIPRLSRFMSLSIIIHIPIPIKPSRPSAQGRRVVALSSLSIPHCRRSRRAPVPGNTTQRACDFSSQRGDLGPKAQSITSLRHRWRTRGRR